jgi:hypothetical protein
MPESALFTEEERADILRFLGYPNYRDQLTASIQLGVPGVVTQVLFTIVANMDKIASASREVVRIYLCELRSIEAQQSQARSRMRATSIGEIKTNPMESALLEGEFDRWVAKLADAFGTVPNPYAIARLGGAGVNGRSIG